MLSVIRSDKILDEIQPKKLLSSKATDYDKMEIFFDK